MSQGEEVQQGEYAILGERNAEVRRFLLLILYRERWFFRVNAKLGGVNNILDSSPFNDLNNPTIVMGKTECLFDLCLTLL